MKVKYNYKNDREKVLQECCVIETWQWLQKIGFPDEAVNEVSIRFSGRMTNTAAQVATFPRKDYKCEFTYSSWILANNPFEKFINTIIHEVSHVKADKSRKQSQDHNSYWKSVLAEMTGKPVSEVNMYHSHKTKPHKKSLKFGYCSLCGEAILLRNIEWERLRDDLDNIREPLFQHAGCPKATLLRPGFLVQHMNDVEELEIVLKLLNEKDGLEDEIRKIEQQL